MKVSFDPRHSMIDSIISLLNFMGTEKKCVDLDDNRRQKDKWEAK